MSKLFLVRIYSQNEIKLLSNITFVSLTSVYGVLLVNVSSTYSRIILAGSGQLNFSDVIPERRRGTLTGGLLNCSLNIVSKVT